jgi:putative peptidoglycan lipid II flippase
VASQHSEKMLTAARTVVAFGITLQAAGFAKLLVTANYFGAGPVLDAYYLGAIVPTFLAGVSGGILQTGFVPAYVGALARGDEVHARTLGNTTLTWTALTLSVITLLLTLAQRWAVPLLAQDLGPEARRALSAAFVLLLWTAPINAVADAGALLLNAQGRFAAAAAAPLVNALVGTIVLLLLRREGIDALVWSLAAGLVSQAGIVLVAIRRAGIHLRPQLRLPKALPQLLGAVALPVVLSMVLGNFIPAFVQGAAARGGPGAVSAMGYASRLHNALVQAVVISVSTVLLPHFARLLAEGRRHELRATLERVFAAALLFSAAALALVAAGGPLMVRLLLERGHFSAGDAQLVARVWLALTFGLLGATWGISLARFFQAQRRLWFIFALGCISLVANVSLAFTLLPMWGVVGIALANSIAYTIVMLVCHAGVDRTLGRVLSRHSAAFVLRTVLANLAAYAVAVQLANFFGGMSIVGVIAGQLAIVAGANLLVARSAPLGLSLGALLRV